MAGDVRRRVSADPVDRLAPLRPNAYFVDPNFTPPALMRHNRNIHVWNKSEEPSFLTFAFGEMRDGERRHIVLASFRSRAILYF
jgi:hypothetical protein